MWLGNSVYADFCYFKKEKAQCQVHLGVFQVLQSQGDTPVCSRACAQHTGLGTRTEIASAGAVVTETLTPHPPSQQDMDIRPVSNDCPPVHMGSTAPSDIILLIPLATVSSVNKQEFELNISGGNISYTPLCTFYHITSRSR